MIISDRKKFIFIHIYKTGGTSVTANLIQYARLRQRLVDEFELTKYMTRKIASKSSFLEKILLSEPKHARALEIKEAVGQDMFFRYYKFSFVRNPWAWQVSHYSHIKRVKSHKHHDYVSSISFSDFIKWQIDREESRQIDFLTDENGEIIVDNVGKIESLESDFRKVCLHLSIPYEGLQRRNTAPDKQKEYAKYYNSKTADLVENYFKLDIDTFGYVFNC